MTVSNEIHELGEKPDELATLGSSERRPYVRPELVRYGALQEVTRAYTQTRNCKGAQCSNG
jgi:hypothetical protein